MSITNEVVYKVLATKLILSEIHSVWL